MGFNDVGCGFLSSLSGDSHNSGFVPGVTPDFDIIDPERFAHPSQILQSRSQIFLSLSNGSFLLFEFSNPFRALFVTFSKPFRTVRSSVSNYPVRLAFSDRLIPFKRTVALSQILVSLSAGSLLLSQILQTLWNGSFLFSDSRILSSGSLFFLRLSRPFLPFRASLLKLSSLPLASREWKNGSNGSYNCTPFLHSLLTKGNP